MVVERPQERLLPDNIRQLQAAETASDGGSSDAETIPSMLTLEVQEDSESSSILSEKSKKAAYLSRLSRARSYNESRLSGKFSPDKAKLIAKQLSDSATEQDAPGSRESTPLGVMTGVGVQNALPSGIARPVLEIAAQAGAMHSGQRPLRHAWSSRAGLLAICNARSELMLFDIAEPDTPVFVTRLPDTEVPFLGWDPSSEMFLAIVRGQYLAASKSVYFARDQWLRSISCKAVVDMIAYQGGLTIARDRGRSEMPFRHVGAAWPRHRSLARWHRRTHAVMGRHA